MSHEGSIRCHAFTPFIKGSMVGESDLQPHGLVVKDCPVHCRGGNRWMTLPGKPLIGPGRKALSREHGNFLNSLFSGFVDPDDGRAFSEATALAFERFALEAFGDPAAEMPSRQS